MRQLIRKKLGLFTVEYNSGHKFEGIVWGVSNAQGFQMFFKISGKSGSDELKNSLEKLKEIYDVDIMSVFHNNFPYESYRRYTYFSKDLIEMNDMIKKLGSSNLGFIPETDSLSVKLSFTLDKNFTELDGLWKVELI